MTRRRRTTATLVVMLAFAILAVPAAQAAKAPPVYKPPLPPGAKTLKFRFGPMYIKPGQNTIGLAVNKQRPSVNGWIVGFRPGMVRVRDGKSPPVTEVHLHHAVWLVNFRPTWAAGEEKTYFWLPRGFGYRYTTTQSWLLNHMIHNLTPTGERIYLTYEVDFIPDSAPQAKAITEVQTRWMDVQGLKPYPVFDTLRGAGANGRFTYPDQAANPYPAGRIRNRWVVDHDGTLVASAGHLHPGGLWTDLNVTRGGRTVRIFRSRAHYFEPAGAVSWDVAMTATTPKWRVALKKGDVLSTNATYDTTKASWYEVMGIMVSPMTLRPAGGVDPFTGNVDQTDVLTHPRLKENIDSGGRPNPGLSNPTTLADGPLQDKVVIKNYTYQQGDLSLRGRKGLPPVVREGQQLTFVNQDPNQVVFHTITGCKQPCNRSAGIRFPLADGAPFDSGELGFGPVVNLGEGDVPFTAAANTDTFKTPTDLKPGTYAYFCRVHPFMRGAFRVKQP